LFVSIELYGWYGIPEFNFVLCLDDVMPVSFGQNCLNLTCLQLKAIQPTPVKQKVCQMYLSKLVEILGNTINLFTTCGSHTVLNGSGFDL